MSRANILAFGLFVGAVAMALVNLAVESERSQAHAAEPLLCKDTGDMKAYMARRPGEDHTTETCVYFMRYGDPRWVPDFGSPLPPKPGV